MLFLKFSTHCEGYKLKPLTSSKENKRKIMFPIQSVVFSDILSSMNNMEIEKIEVEMWFSFVSRTFT